MLFMTSDFLLFFYTYGLGSLPLSAVKMELTTETGSKTMRMHTRHPFDVSIHYMFEDSISDQYDHVRRLKDICERGLCFRSQLPVEIGARIHMEIPMHDPAFEVEGIVSWCKKANGYEVGVKFEEDNIEHTSRIVEQACDIKHYLHQEQKSGRKISTNQAAQEWILKCATVTTVLNGN